MASLLINSRKALHTLFPPGYSPQAVNHGVPESSTLVDTHDWRLWNSGVIALFGKDFLEVRDLSSWTVKVLRSGAFNKDQLLLDGEEPAEENLKKIIRPRALSRNFEISRRADTYVIRNADEKIVCRAEISELTIDGPKSPKVRIVSLEPLKGYGPETRKIEAYMESSDVASKLPDPVSLLLKNHKENPLAFKSHKSIHLEGGIPLQGSASNLLLTLTDIMADSVEGIINDIDSEFLHDYRVCTRKSRAFLSLLKRSLNPQAAEPHRVFLKECGNATTEMRDLDVYTLEFPHFYKLLPPSLNEHLNAFCEEIATKRRTAHWKLCMFLRDEKYKAKIALWRKMLISGSLFRASAASDSNLVGRELIARRYKKVCKLASRITDHSPDPDLHALRIECKKLRYCIEFFKAVVNEPVVGELLALLKTLQDVLGDFNDMSVQQQWLYDALHSHEASRAAGVHGAIGGLMTSLYAKQQDYRKLVYEKFALFIDEGVSSRIMNMKKAGEAKR
jgi:CHAD domain-containing protein